MKFTKPSMTARACGAFAVACASALAVSAIHAAPLAPTLLPPAAVVSAVAPCFGSDASAAHGVAAPVSKAAAILGIEVSALERMRMQQGSPVVSDSPSPLLAQAEYIQYRPIEPAARNSGRFRPDCAAVPSIAARNGLAGIQEAGSGDYLASRRLAIGRTQFDADWTRVKSESVAMAGDLRRMIGAGANRTATLAAVNRWANREIAYVEDRKLYRQSDYWAGARRTLKLGKGDCEDIALAKLQLLAAAGIPRSDMILTIARDPVRRSDHAVLIVREDDGYIMLDNTTDQLLDARRSYEYRPVLSFGANQSWLHGY